MTTSSDWTAWQGGECPVAPETQVDVCFRSGRQPNPDLAGFWYWGRAGSLNNDGDVVAYRIVSPAPPTAVQAAVEAEREAPDAVEDEEEQEAAQTRMEAVIRENAAEVALADACNRVRELFREYGRYDRPSLEGVLAAIRSRGNGEGK